MLPIRNAIILQDKIQSLISQERLSCLPESRPTLPSVSTDATCGVSTAFYTSVGPLSNESQISLHSYESLAFEQL